MPRFADADIEWELPIPGKEPTPANIVWWTLGEGRTPAGIAHYARRRGYTLTLARARALVAGCLGLHHSGDWRAYYDWYRGSGGSAVPPQEGRT